MYVFSAWRDMLEARIVVIVSMSSCGGGGGGGDDCSGVGSIA